MKLKVQFEVAGEPIAKGRARAFVRNGHVGHYTPDKTAKYENLVKLCAMQAMAGRQPGTMPVEISVIAKIGIGKSWSKKRQADALAGNEFPTKRPDLDNIVKSATDGMNGVVFVDDSLIVHISAIKIWSDCPGLEVDVREI